MRAWLLKLLGLDRELTRVSVLEADYRAVSSVLEGQDRRIRALEERPAQHLDRALAIAQSLAEATLRPMQVAAATAPQPGPSIAHELPDDVLDVIAEFASPSTGLYAELVSHAFQLLRRGVQPPAIVAEIRRGGGDWEETGGMRVIPGDDREADEVLAAAISRDPMTPDEGY